MSISRKICLALTVLSSSIPVHAAGPSNALALLHRGDFVKVRLFEGSTYHLQLSGFDEASLVGRSGNMSVHLHRGEIASVEHETAPRTSLQGLTPATIFSLLSLTAVRSGAAHSFGNGQACNSTNSVC